jgi:hypothetical protein
MVKQQNLWRIVLGGLFVAGIAMTTAQTASAACCICNDATCISPSNGSAQVCTAQDTCAGNGGLDMATDAQDCSGVAGCGGTPPSCTTDADCNDANTCTTDTCIGGTCNFANNTNSCSDADACTSGDTCSGGACVGTPIPDCTAVSTGAPLISSVGIGALVVSLFGLAIGTLRRKQTNS